MSRNANNLFVKPRLEELEDRIQPSFLLNGSVQQQLLPPLQAMYTDMQNAKTDLQVQFNLLSKIQTPPLTLAQAENAYGKGAADYQRILNDQHAISATVTADLAFIRAAAFAEFSEGDVTDAIIVFFGPFIHFDPTSVLTNVQTQANNLVNGNDVQTWVTTDFFPTSPLDTHNTFAMETTTPSF